MLMTLKWMTCVEFKWNSMDFLMKCRLLIHSFVLLSIFAHYTQYAMQWKREKFQNLLPFDYFCFFHQKIINSIIFVQAKHSINQKFLLDINSTFSIFLHCILFPVHALHNHFVVFKTKLLWNGKRKGKKGLKKQ